MKSLKDVHPIVILSAVVVIVGVVFLIINILPDDEDKFAAMAESRGPVPPRDTPPGSGRGTNSGGSLDEMGERSGLAGWSPLESIGKPLCSETPDLCSSAGKTFKNSVSRGRTTQECCRNISCERDYNPDREHGAGSSWIGCADTPTDTGVGQMVYNVDLSDGAKAAGKTVEECCIYEPPTCLGVLNQGNGNQGCSTYFVTNGTYDIGVNEQKCNSLYTKNTNSTTGYYECEWNATTELCEKKTTTASTGGVECSPPTSQTCISGNSWQLGGTTAQGNCTCPSSDPLKTHVDQWRCLA